MFSESRINQKQGFTLLELVVVVALTGVIFSISAPALGAIVRKTEARKQIESIALWLSTLHAKALNRQHDITVKFSHPTFTATDGAGKFIGRKSIPDKADLTISSQDIRFYASGVESPSTVRLILQSIWCKASLSLRGRITTLCSNET